VHLVDERAREHPLDRVGNWTHGLQAPFAILQFVRRMQAGYRRVLCERRTLVVEEHCFKAISRRLELPRDDLQAVFAILQFVRRPDVVERVTTTM
jgi:hypothetical protein